jgi:hypothetical protein
MTNRMTKEQRYDMRREIILREINQGALAGISSEISEQAADLVLNALDAFDAWADAGSRELIEAENLEAHAAIYQATPNQRATYREIAFQLSEHARLTRMEYDEKRIKAAKKRGRA